MSKKTYNLFLSILIPIYSIIFILIANYYLNNQNDIEKSFANMEQNKISELKRLELEQSTSTLQIPIEDILKNEEAVSSEVKNDTFATSSPNSSSTKDYIKSFSVKSYDYIEIVNSCDEHYDGECLNARSGPGKNFSSVAKLRNNMILKTDGQGIGSDGQVWYHVVFDEWIRYPERLKGEWFVSGDYVRPLEMNVEKILNQKDFKEYYNTKENKKTILVKLKDQKLFAYENINGENKLFLETFVSTGLEDLPTPIGTFEIFYKTPSRYMQGPLPGVSDDVYDLPGVPSTMYFTKDGAAIHGSYWHDNFGNQWSHGCINLYPYDAENLYRWADLGTQVIVEP